MLGELLQAKRGEISLYIKWKDYLQELSQDIIITLHSEHMDNLYPQGETYHISTR